MAFSKVDEGRFGPIKAWKVITGLSIFAVVIPICWAITISEFASTDETIPLDAVAQAAPARAEDVVERRSSPQEQRDVDATSQIASKAESRPAEAAQAYAAVLTCRISGVQMQVSTCIVGSNDDVSGSLKIENGRSVKQYSDVEVLQEFSGSVARIPLESTFDVMVQVNSIDGAVMRLEIHDAAGRTVYANEAPAMNILNASS
jgi:hypothetical protein